MHGKLVTRLVAARAVRAVHAPPDAPPLMRGAACRRSLWSSACAARCATPCGRAARRCGGGGTTRPVRLPCTTERRSLG
jgi:hypothetical protein